MKAARELLELLRAVPEAYLNEPITFRALKALLEEAVEKAEYAAWEDMMGEDL